MCEVREGGGVSRSCARFGRALSVTYLILAESTLALAVASLTSFVRNFLYIQADIGVKNTRTKNITVRKYTKFDGSPSPSDRLAKYSRDSLAASDDGMQYNQTQSANHRASITALWARKV